jgi:peptidyl-prolyl cis-trans isomerase C
VKKDIVLALIAVVVVAAVSFGLATMRPNTPAAASSPAGTQSSAKATEKDGDGSVVIRVNGEPVTDREFAAFLSAAPENARAFYTNPAGRKALGEEIVKLKLLEQQAKKMGLADDPEIKSRMEMIRSQMVAGRALEKLVADRAEKELHAEYEKQKASAVALKHIVIAYEGGAIPPRQGAPLSEAKAMQKAGAIATQLRGGADFGQLALAESDDRETAGNGGSLGPVRPEMLPPEVANVVKTMKAGQVSQPVKTQYGVHVFKVEAPTFEELRPMLAQQIQKKVMDDVVAGLEKSAKIQYDEKFFPEPKADSPAAAPAPNPKR